MNNYVGQKTVSQILGNALKIYRDHFPIILLAFLPALPFAILRDVAWGFAETVWVKTLAAGFDYFFSLLVVPLVMTVVVSDICVGNPPSLLRSFRRLRVLTLSKLAVTYLWAGVPFFLAVFLTFLIPAIADTLLFMLLIAVVGFGLYSAMMFFPSVVVLQNLWSWDALRRSASLGKGSYLRNAGMVVGIYVLNFVFYFVLVALWKPFDHPLKNFLLTTIISSIVGLLIKPFAVICIVLMYYDRRTRWNGPFDPARLAAEVGSR